MHHVTVFSALVKADVTYCCCRRAVHVTSRIQREQNLKHRAVNSRQPFSQLRPQHWKRETRWTVSRAQIEGLDEPIADYGVLTQKMQVSHDCISPKEGIM